MTKIDIIQQQLQPMEQNVLDIYQMKILSMYEKLINEPNIYDYIYAIGTNGYITCIEKNENNAVYFYGFTNNYGWSVNGTFQDCIIFFVKRLLKDWHEKKTCDQYNYRKVGFGPEKTVSTNLTHQQRGVLTKILKIENKRQKNLKR